eukprot:TRINITY_DN3039_c0_g1_i1.p2 TRINITY_DN3039_c0_g1~~TRINITY_DN3039_c0_g1_i1.p2  ORF type:complete len:151 (-),score=36.37 TRINITY_DN3039_c0_g1_i1:527-979(-)
MDFNSETLESLLKVFQRKQTQKEQADENYRQNLQLTLFKSISKGVLFFNIIVFLTEEEIANLTMTTRVFRDLLYSSVGTKLLIISQSQLAKRKQAIPINNIMLEDYTKIPNLNINWDKINEDAMAQLTAVNSVSSPHRFRFQSLIFNQTR